MNTDRRPIPPEILAAVAEGAMPLAVFADWLEENDWPAYIADTIRRPVALLWIPPPGCPAEVVALEEAVNAALLREFNARLIEEFQIPSRFVGEPGDYNYAAHRPPP